MFNDREKGLLEFVDLISDALNAKIKQLEEEKAEELSSSLLEKIPECPVNIKLCFKKSMFYLFNFKVCFEKFKKDQPVYSCLAGHNLCGTCKANRTIKVRLLIDLPTILF